MNTYSVVLDGFISKEEAEELLIWYMEQGEQDASVWLETAREKNPTQIRDFLPIATEFKWNGNTLQATIKE